MKLDTLSRILAEICQPGGCGAQVRDVAASAVIIFAHNYAQRTALPMPMQVFRSAGTTMCSGNLSTARPATSRERGSTDSPWR